MPLTREAALLHTASPLRSCNDDRLFFTRKAREENEFTRCAVLNRQMGHGKALFKNNGATWKRMTSGLKSKKALAFSLVQVLFNLYIRGGKGSVSY